MRRLQGIAAAPGYAIGPIFQYQPTDLRVEPRFIANPDQEIERLGKALSAAAGQIRAVIEKTRTEMSADQASIFEARLLMLQDPELSDTIRKAIADRNLNAEFAVKSATEHDAQALESMQAGCFRARAAD